MLGYVPIYRHILDSPIASNAHLLGLYTYLLLKANHTSAVFYLGSIKVSLKPGEMVTSQKKLSEQFHVSISTIHSRLKILSDEKLIKLKTTTKFTHVTCLHREHKENQSDTSRKQSESRSKADGKPAKTNNNDNTEKKDNHGDASQKSTLHLIQKLQTTAEELGIIYDGSRHDHFTQLLVNDAGFLKLCEKQSMSPTVMASEIMKKSALIKFRKGVCAGPKDIYYNYAEVFNKSKDLNLSEIDVFIAGQAKHIEEKLLNLKKLRAQKYPYKAPFSSVAHVSQFIEAIEKNEI